MKITPEQRKVITKVCIKVRESLIDKHRTVTGYCEDASERIVKELKKKGIKVARTGGVFCVDDDPAGEILDHSWVTYKGIIIDATLDQFNDYGLRFPEVFFGDEHEDIASCYMTWKQLKAWKKT